MENDLLRGRLLHLKTGGRGNLGNGVLAGIQPLALLMELDLTVGVRQDIPEVDGAGSVRRLAVGSIGDMEFCPLNGCARNRILFENRQFRGLVILEYHRLFIARIQRDGLYPVRVLVRQIVGGGDGFLGNAVSAGVHPQRNRAVRAGSHIMLIVTVDALHG